MNVSDGDQIKIKNSAMQKMHNEAWGAGNRAEEGQSQPLRLKNMYGKATEKTMRSNAMG